MCRGEARYAAPEPPRPSNTPSLPPRRSQGKPCKERRRSLNPLLPCAEEVKDREEEEEKEHHNRHDDMRFPRRRQVHRLSDRTARPASKRRSKAAPTLHGPTRAARSQPEYAKGRQAHDRYGTMNVFRSTTTSPTRSFRSTYAASCRAHGRSNCHEIAGSKPRGPPRRSVADTERDANRLVPNTAERAESRRQPRRRRHKCKALRAMPLASTQTPTRLVDIGPGISRPEDRRRTRTRSQRFPS